MRGVIVKISIIGLFATSLFCADAAKIYQKCAGCHGEKGRHKAFNRSGIIGGEPKEEILEKLKFFKEGDFPSQSTSKVMKKQLKNLSEEDLEKLADYISHL